MRGRSIAGTVILAVGLALVIYPLVAWYRQPDLTQMQIFLIYWHYDIGALVCVVAGALLSKRSRE